MDTIRALNDLCNGKILKTGSAVDESETIRLCHCSSWRPCCQCCRSICKYMCRSLVPNGWKVYAISSIHRLRLMWCFPDLLLSEAYCMVIGLHMVVKSPWLVVHCILTILIFVKICAFCNDVALYGSATGLSIVWFLPVDDATWISILISSFPYFVSSTWY